MEDERKHMPPADEGDGSRDSTLPGSPLRNGGRQDLLAADGNGPDEAPLGGATVGAVIGEVAGGLAAGPPGAVAGGVAGAAIGSAAVAGSDDQEEPVPAAEPDGTVHGQPAPAHHRPER